MHIYIEIKLVPNLTIYLFIYGKMKWSKME
jgi:hypothetical protein